MFRLKAGTVDESTTLDCATPARMRVMRFLLVLLLSLSANVCVQAQSWKVVTSGLDTNLRGVSIARAAGKTDVSSPVVWASGSNGVILRSLDDGKTWQRLHVGGGDAMDFRGIVAFNSTMAYVMSSGEGERSRIYKTTDGGETWKLQYTDDRKELFLDTIACVSETHCFAFGDPVGGKFLLLTTTDGEHWNPFSSGNMPAALPGEGAFAASNTCLLLAGQEIFFGTGGPAARVFHSRDSGRNWTVSETPVAHGKASSGIFSLALWRGKDVVVVGGDYQDPKGASSVAAYSLDEIQTWQLSKQQPGGYRSGVASNSLSIFAVGPNGEDSSEDGGVHWKHTDSLNLNAVAILDIWNGWAVGPNGTIARFLNHNAAEIRYRRPDRRQPSSAYAIAD